MFSRAAPSFMASQEAQTPEMRQGTVLKAIMYLKEVRVPCTLTALQEKFPHLAEGELSRHQSVVTNLETMSFLYKPRVAIKYKRAVSDKEGILALCEDNPGGVLLSDLEDAYQGAKDDIKALLADHSLLSLDNTSGRTNDGSVIFPASVAAVGTPVAPSIKSLWDSIPLPPTLADLEQRLVDSGHTVLSRVAPVAPARVGQQRRARPGAGAGRSMALSRGQHFANKHMQHLLRSGPPQ